MNIYTGSDEISEDLNVVSQKSCSTSKTFYENVCFENDVVLPKNSSISKTLYENVSFKKDRKVEITESNKKLKMISSKPMKRKNLIFVLFVVLFIAALATSFGLIAMNINDVDQQKQEYEVGLSTLIEDVNQLKQNITYQTEIIDNQFIVIKSQNDSINELQGIIIDLKEQEQQDGFDDNLQILNETTNTTNENLINGYIILDNGWIAPLNGFQYKLFKDSQDWDCAQSYCQKENKGNLASLGVQSVGIRRIIREAIQYTGDVWIGLNDQSSEGTWRWLSSIGSNDEDYATNDISLWYQKSPNNCSSCYDCAVLYDSSAYAYPCKCSSSNYFLCEKKII